MTMEQSEKQGWIFTGAAWGSWEKDQEVKYKAKAQKIKDMYKGADFRIVTGKAKGWLSIGHKAIMGNKIYCKVQYYDKEETKSYIDNFALRKADLEKEYKEKLAKLEKAQCEKVNLYNEMMSLEK